MVDVKDLPQELLDSIRERFDADSRVMELRERKRILQGSGNFVLALEIGKRIDALFDKTVEIYVDSMREEAVDFGKETSDIPQADKDALIDKLMVLFMCCDIIESAVMDFNSILHKSKPDCDVTSFGDMVKLSKMARTKMRYLEKNSEYLGDVTWGERCDDMYEMMCNKARSIVRKRKEKDWGKGFKRLESK